MMGRASELIRENERLHAFTLRLAQRLFLAAEVLSHRAEKRTMAVEGLLPYPDSFPMAAGLQLVLSAFRGGDVDKAEALRAAWHLSGFALGKVAPNGPKIFGASDTDTFPVEVVESAFMTAQNAEAGFRGAQEAVPWGLIAQVAWQVFQSLLKRK